MWTASSLCRSRTDQADLIKLPVLQDAGSNLSALQRASHSGGASRFRPPSYQDRPSRPFSPCQCFPASTALASIEWNQAGSHRRWKVFHVFLAQRSGILLRSIALAGLRGGPLRRNFGRRTLGAPIKCRDCTHWKITAYPVGFSTADGSCLSPGGMKPDWRYSAYAMSLNQALSADGTDIHNRHTASQELARPRLLHLSQMIDSIGICLS